MPLRKQGPRVGKYIACGPALLLPQEHGTKEKPDEIRLRVHHGEQAQRHDLCRIDQRPARQSVPASHRHDRGLPKDKGCKHLVWYEAHEDLDGARLRERQMKKWKRAWKIELIERDNPQWKDLYGTLFG
ncbi:putative GIY-YIG superfamily endonuclease [Sphingomonas trueperi]